MKSYCAAVLLAVCAVVPARADQLTRWLDERVEEIALARLGLEPTDLLAPERFLDGWEGPAPWGPPMGPLGPPRLLPPRLQLSLGLHQGSPAFGVSVAWSWPRRFPARPRRPMPRGTPPPTPDDLAWLLEGEPTIESVQRAAVEYVGCGPEVLGRMDRDSRAFGALPELSLGAGLDGDHDVDVDPFDNVEGAEDGRGWDLSVDLKWDLADLVMSYERIRILSEQGDRMELRARVIEEVTSLYFDRQRLRAQLELHGDMELTDRALLLLELEETTARLDALTSGEFGRLREALDTRRQNSPRR